MVKQYPDTLLVTTSGSSVQDGEGNWTVTAGTVNTILKCRYEPNDSNGFINTVGGSRIDFSGIAYMPKDVIRIKEGSRVSVTERREGQADFTFTDTVKRFSRGQLNTRVWL